MKARHCKITISLDDNVACWLRLEAQRKRLSVSELIAEIVKERMIQKDNYEAAKRRALAREPFLNTDGTYLSREDAHDRHGLR